ncbi:MAG: amidohydrolase family protein, partial [Gammaproteobacteria bacterium]|nr:amidohydrolase family protein [Gammaproteobacteria bacterium]
MVEVGISPMDAITISTANAADLMRLEKTGRIREGAVADLLAVDGNPLEDIEAVANSAHHRLVLKRGRPVTRVPVAEGRSAAALAAAQ